MIKLTNTKHYLFNCTTTYLEVDIGSNTLKFSAGSHLIYGEIKKLLVSYFIEIEIEQQTIKIPKICSAVTLARQIKVDLKNQGINCNIKEI